MKRMEKYLGIVLSLLLALSLPMACSTIDDDRSDCVDPVPPGPEPPGPEPPGPEPPGPEPPQPEPEYEMDYELQLVTNMVTELQTELTTQTDINVAQALRTYLSTIFTDFAHDVDLSFYDTQGDSIRLQHDQHVMDANQASYTLNLPKRQYMHLAAANIVDNPIVALANDEFCHQSKLLQLANDTITSHTTGLFTARLPMEILEGVDQSFDVRLYMANCATTLVVDTIGSGLKDMKVITTGFATGFNIADSTYIFGAKSPIIRTSPVTTHEAGRMKYCSVNFPSPEAPITRTIIETEEPFISVEAADALWELHIYVTTASGSVTENILYVKSPLRAGQLKVIKAKAFTNGSLDSEDKSVAVSVRLDWSEGGGHDIEL